MKQENYYDLLGLSPDADLAEIHQAHLRISKFLSSGESLFGPTQAALRKKLIDHAHEVLSNPTLRADYDASLTQKGKQPDTGERPLYIEVGLEPNRASPIRRLLTIIASVMVIGLVFQVSIMVISYQRAKAITGENGSSATAEKIYLQEFYQTYGIRAASRAEAELLLADMRRKEQQASEESQKQRLQEDQEYKQKLFEEESRRIGAEVSENIQQAKQEAARQKEAELQQKEAELRQKEERELAEKAAERARLDHDINRFRSRPTENAE